MSMIISKKFKIIAKNKEFIIKKIELREVNKSYIDSLRFAKYLKHKKVQTIGLQKKYLKIVKKKKNSFILGFFCKKKFLGTLGCQLYKKKIINKKLYYNVASFGILIFSGFRNNKFGQLMITSFSKILSDIFNIKVIFATINLKNLMSIKAFKKSAEYTDDEEEYISIILEKYRLGEIPLKTTQKIKKALDYEANPLKVIKILKDAIPDELLIDKRQTYKSGLIKNEVILSEYIKGN